MAQKITDFIGGFGGGLRPNRFRVTGKMGLGESTTIFHIKSSTIPGSKISTIEIPYRGRTFKMPGTRLYDSWDITVLDDSEEGNGTSLWDDFHQWSENFNSHEGNLIKQDLKYSFGSDGTNNNNLGMNNWSVEQLDINGNSVKKITLWDCWPSRVGQILLSMDNNEELVTFPVTLQYQYLEIDDVT